MTETCLFQRKITRPLLGSGKLILVRHGQTDGNVAKLMLGSRTNPPLNATGRQQAHRLARALLHVGADQLFASDMLRARETAGIIGLSQGLDVHLTPNLRETDHGILDGLAMNDPSMTAEFACRKVLKGAYRPPGGESCLDVAGRLTGWIKTHEASLEGRTSIVVCHLGVIRAFAIALSHLPAADAFFSQDHDQLSEVDFRSGMSRWSVPIA